MKRGGGVSNQRTAVPCDHLGDHLGDHTTQRQQLGPELWVLRRQDIEKVPKKARSVPSNSG